MLLTGLIQASGVVLFSVIFNLMVRFGTIAYNIEAIVFTCVSVVSAALMLSLFAGPGRLVNATLRTPSTWFYGISAIGVFLLDVYLSRYVSATEMSLFGRMAIPISLFVSFFIFKRNQVKSDVIGLVFVLAGLYMLFAIQAPSVLWIIVALALATGVVQAGEVIFAETHSQSHAAHQTGNMRDKARVVGFVSFVTSMMFLLLVLGGSLLHTYLLPHADTLSFLPPLERFVHGPSVWLGLLYGIVFASTGRYLFWSASYKLKSDNILALLAFVPLITFVVEWVLSLTPYMAANESMFAGERGQFLFIACLLLTFGSGLSVFLRVRNKMAKERTGNFWTDVKRALTIDSAHVSSIQHAANALDDYEVIHATLTHVGHDMVHAAELLNTPPDTLHVIHEGKGTLALSPEASQNMARRYRTHVANRDPLTGLYNRGALLSRASDALDKGKRVSILYIDLDRFKPVNDTHGHEAGDYVLKMIAARIESCTPKDSFVARMGGDEFCVVLINTSATNVAATAEKIADAANKPFKLTGVRQNIHIGASIGIATAPKHGDTIDALIAYADQSMYRVKKAR